MKKVILLYALILFLGIEFLLYIWNYTLLSTYNAIGHSQFKISTILYSILLISVLIIALKRVNKLNPNISIRNLFLAGTVLFALSEVCVQIVKQLLLNDIPFSERVYQYFEAVLKTTLFVGMWLSFFIAFQIKTKKTDILVVFVFAYLALFKILQYFFPSVFW